MGAHDLPKVGLLYACTITWGQCLNLCRLKARTGGVYGDGKKNGMVNWKKRLFMRKSTCLGLESLC